MPRPWPQPWPTKSTWSDGKAATGRAATTTRPELARAAATRLPSSRRTAGQATGHHTRSRSVGGLPSAGVRQFGDGRRRAGTRQPAVGAQEVGVAEGEDAPVGAEHVVARSTARRLHVDAAGDRKSTR